MATWNQLPKPKFTDAEIAACKWAEECNLRGFMVDMKTKGVTYLPPKGGKLSYSSLVEFAAERGWTLDGERRHT